MTTEPLIPLPRRILDAIARLTLGRPAEFEDGAALTPIPARAPYRCNPMRVHLVCYENEPWIVDKIARSLQRELALAGVEATLGKSPDPAAEINHHLIYDNYLDRLPTLETVMITHINDERELEKVRRQLVDLDVEMGICMSFEMVHRMAHFSIPREKLCFVSPAHDHRVQPRRIVVGLTTRLYPDGRKREHVLEQLTDTISPAEFGFAIMGSGWEDVIARIREKGFSIQYVDHFDEAIYYDLIAKLDYYLYLGHDEGSMGFLDALAAGVATIVPPHGFHLDVAGGVTHPVMSLADLKRVFEGIARERRDRITAVKSQTWTAYARKHMMIWEYVRCRKAGRPIPPELGEELVGMGLLPRSDVRRADWLHRNECEWS